MCSPSKGMRMMRTSTFSIKTKRSSGPKITPSFRAFPQKKTLEPLGEITKLALSLETTRCSLTLKCGSTLPLKKRSPRDSNSLMNRFWAMPLLMRMTCLWLMKVSVCRLCPKYKCCLLCSSTLNSKWLWPVLLSQYSLPRNNLRLPNSAISTITISNWVYGLNSPINNKQCWGIAIKICKTVRVKCQWNLHFRMSVPNSNRLRELHW